MLIAFFLIVGLAGSALLYVAQGLQPVEAKDEIVEVEILPGMSVAQMTTTLEEAGLVKNATIFNYYLKYKGIGSQFQAGTYAMKPGITLDNIIYKLNSGDVVQEDMIEFTIPEGWTIDQMMTALGEDGLIDTAAFVEALQDPTAYISTLKWIENIPQSEYYSYDLEGYLFPETYALLATSNEQDIVLRMLEELNNKLNTLPADWEQQLDKLGITFHEMMTIASLIEREVIVDAERPIVASVIYNRLAIPMRLQIDATVQYALGEQKERLFEVDLQIDSPYNTYAIDGIPPGPIAAPGYASIEAALYPDETNYLFYVTKKDGTQEHLFAETYNDHLNNIAISKQQ